MFINNKMGKKYMVYLYEIENERKVYRRQMVFIDKMFR